ncbi:MAG: phytanoyl-CoA dioxygenase family protein [Aestuariivita sp.]|nr:phytanoyl-CoA dioxygenase family protein [Aestuariivita sp.]MCY4203291.1 phytanoyl-CoA dioxygenase family protein [Aestuariivita sp.]MCY4287182.1 phytanoyl-CoA dioxygenase family protein [Aestuariivita sp.]MCY4347510.1 phytanoyl-CoA dioxygenase family protein [Aestuariivita sp.]
MSELTVSEQQICDFQNEGVVCLRGLFLRHVERLRQGVAFNLAHPGPHASTNDKQGERGLFFDDYCNWSRIAQFEEVISDPIIIAAAGALMQSARVQMFHDHVLVKEPGTSMVTPWHSDGPYYFVSGDSCISFWVPLDPVREATLRCVAGSHLWEKDVLPTRWVSETAFFEGDYMAVPDPEIEGMPIREWEMAAGDAVAFHFRTLHGARGNHANRPRRAFSLRLVGDNARYVARPGPTSPPFSGHSMIAGQRLRQDWFPLLR